MTRTIQFQVDDEFFQAIVNKAQEKGFNNYQDYIKELCIQDSMVDLDTIRKFNRIMEILSE